MGNAVHVSVQGEKDLGFRVWGGRLEVEGLGLRVQGGPKIGVARIGSDEASLPPLSC